MSKYSNKRCTRLMGKLRLFLILAFPQDHRAKHVFCSCRARDRMSLKSHFNAHAKHRIERLVVTRTGDNWIKRYQLNHAMN